MKVRTATIRHRPAMLAALSATAICGAALLTACAPGGTSQSVAQSLASATAFNPNQKVTITISDGWGTTGTGATFGDVIKAFEAKYPNVTVDRESTDYASYQQTINTLGSSPNPPDVLMLETSGYGQGFYQFVQAGLLLPLDSYAKEYGWTTRFGAASNLDVFRFDAADHNQWGQGNLYGVPEQNSMITVFYNKELLAKAGISAVPSTFAQFEQSLAAAKAKGITPIAESSTYIHTEMALWDSFVTSSAAVNDWVYGDKGASFASPANVKAAQTLADWQQAGYFEPGVEGESDDNAVALFDSGKTLYYIEGSWDAGAVQSALGANAGAFRLPSATAGATAPVGGGLTTPLVISSKSKHPAVAAAFINYFLSVQNSDYLFDNGWGIPGASVSPSTAASPSLTSQILALLTPEEAPGGAGTTPFLDWSTPTFTDMLPTYLQNLAAGHTSAAGFTSLVQSQWSTFQQQRSSS